ncbi:MAG: cupin domain-containing protein [Bacteroidetes bacterium]|nr:cupin domain-containing protein [Bacteroidota bacterium]
MVNPVIHIDSAIRTSTLFDARQMFSSERCEVIHLLLLPGEKMELHVQPFDVVFFILEGSGTLHLESEASVFSENTCISIKAGVMRAWKNHTSSPLRLLVIKLLS